MKETMLFQQPPSQLPGQIIPKHAVEVGRPIGFWQRVTDWVLARLDIPYGYENETGFHYGIEPKPAWLTATAAPESRSLFTDRASDAFVYPSASAPAPIAPPAKKRRQTA